MAKQTWKPGNMLYPLPAVMVSVTDGEGNDNIITVVGWHRVYQPANGKHLRSSHQIFLRYDLQDKGICSEPYHRRACIRHRLLWRAVRQIG